MKKEGVMTAIDLHSGASVDRVTGPRSVKGYWSQRGLSLIEISVVTVIVLLLAVLAVPAIQGYLVENRVPKVGEALAHYVLRQHLNASVHGANQYSGMNIQHFSDRKSTRLNSSHVAISYAVFC